MNEGRPPATADLTMRIMDETIYAGPAITVPRVGDSIERDGGPFRVEAVVWNFAAADGRVSVQLHVGTQPYTF